MINLLLMFELLIAGLLWELWWVSIFAATLAANCLSKRLELLLTPWLLIIWDNPSKTHSNVECCWLGLVFMFSLIFELINLWSFNTSSWFKVIQQLINLEKYKCQYLTICLFQILSDYRYICQPCAHIKC